MATMLEFPALSFARPGPGATRQQVADYHCRMLVADGAIPATSFSPFEPSGDANGADYFFGRAPRRPFAEQKIARQQLLLPPCLIRRNTPAQIPGSLKAHGRTHRITRECRVLKRGLAEGLTTQ